MGIHIVGGWAPVHHDLSPRPSPSLDPGLDPGLNHFHDLGVALIQSRGKRADVCGMCNPAHLLILFSILTEAFVDVEC